MPQQIRMWEIVPDNNTLAEVTASGIGLEERLEDWLESDISMLDDNLLVIGRQVRTPFGGIIDLLCLDDAGDTVIVELKKGKTPREVTAQALDYASWVKDLSLERIREIAAGYSKRGSSLEDAFRSRFDRPLPETLNVNHRSLIVAEQMDDSTERIVRYLSDVSVPVNVATVQHFKDSNGREMLGAGVPGGAGRGAGQSPVCFQEDVGIQDGKPVASSGRRNRCRRIVPESAGRGSRHSWRCPLCQ